MINKAHIKIGDIIYGSSDSADIMYDENINVYDKITDMSNNINEQLSTKADGDHDHDDSYYTKSQANGRFYGYSRGSINTDTSYDAKLYMISNGSNVPCGSDYGVVLGMPYRNLTGNKIPDFGAQIFIPNGDDNTHPNSMFYRTSLANTWNPWQEVATRSDIISVERGGTGQTSITDTKYTTARYRASSLHSSETNPSVNGVIAWTYE